MSFLFFFISSLFCILCHEYMLHSDENKVKTPGLVEKRCLPATGMVQWPGYLLVKRVRNPAS